MSEGKRFHCGHRLSRNCFGCELTDIEAVEIEYLSCFSFDNGFDLHAEKADCWGGAVLGAVHGKS